MGKNCHLLFAAWLLILTLPGRLSAQLEMSAAQNLRQPFVSSTTGWVFGWLALPEFAEEDRRWGPFSLAGPKTIYAPQARVSLDPSKMRAGDAQDWLEHLKEAPHALFREASQIQLVLEGSRGVLELTAQRWSLSRPGELRALGVSRLSVFGAQRTARHARFFSTPDALVAHLFFAESPPETFSFPYASDE